MHESIIVSNSGYIFLKNKTGGSVGNLVVLEGERDIPFPIKRVYYITKIESSTNIRGKHAHRSLEQVIFCVNGSFTLELDDGRKRQNIVMNKENIGVRLGPMLWHTMRDFSVDCVILVIASDYYSEADYIRDYDEFIRLLESSI
ncbi:WxcM-like protein [Leptospira fainei serovar Hurstbridge str. BUT 6]|uniref:WxcM-like protein n=1 Tax=Leptospira fainei serovar Hurstbridge str. BUT 6 TaxID=1193011 RepID=S3V0E5_9LEPT|nr:FdtA/QdtA family cupin domain-containing protein [Leptospira fainei]EPG76151.1 WxcM-like protein [Leptospira fainei serovar Hurstbridge str. BUT 6]